MVYVKSEATLANLAQTVPGPVQGREMRRGLDVRREERRAPVARDGAAARFGSPDPLIDEAFATCHRAPVSLQTGEALVPPGQPLRGLFLVHTGSLKDSSNDSRGREHVSGFYLPGEVTGVDTVHRRITGGVVRALEPSLVRSIPYPELTGLFVQIPGLCDALLRTLSQYSYRAGLLAGDYHAEELLAGFLLMLSRRLSRDGVPGTRVTLTMSRRDVANHLRLAPETVSRLFSRFADLGLIRVSGRSIDLLDPARLSSVADALREM